MYYRYIRFSENTFCDCSNNRLVTISRLKKPYSMVDTGIFNLDCKENFLSFRGIIIQRYGGIYNCRYKVKFPDYINKRMRIIEFDSGFYLLDTKFSNVQYLETYMSIDKCNSYFRHIMKAKYDVKPVRGMFHPDNSMYDFINFGMSCCNFDIVIGEHILHNIRVLFQGIWGILFSDNLIPLALVTFKSWSAKSVIVGDIVYVMNSRFTLYLFKSK